MSLVHAKSPTDLLARAGDSALRFAHSDESKLVGGIAVALAAASASPFAMLSLAGPFAAARGYGATGARAAAAAGFLAFLVAHRPSAGTTLVAGLLAAFVAALAARLVRDQGAEGAVVVECEGFAELDRVYGRSAGRHAYDLLCRAVSYESPDAAMLRDEDASELIVAWDDAAPNVAGDTMRRIERRFMVWMSDAGYDCEMVFGGSPLRA